MPNKVMEDRELLVLDGPHDGEAEEDFTPNSFPTGDKTCLNLVYLAALVAAIGGLLFGYDVGIITGAKLQVAHDLELTCAQCFIASTTAIASFLQRGNLFVDFEEF